MKLISFFVSSALLAVSSIKALSITNPTSNFATGQVIPLNVVLSEGDLELVSTYSAVFSCSAGSYQLNNLVLGATYPVIPPGIFGLVTLTVTATGCATALTTFTVSAPVPNNPPAYVPVQLPQLTYPFPAIYAHFNEHGKAEIDAVAYFNGPEEALSCSQDAQCTEKHIKRLA